MRHVCDWVVALVDTAVDYALTPTSIYFNAENYNGKHNN